MIVTVTLNPSLDRAIEIDALARGDVIRARSGHLDPGGKGVNVSRALLANGVASRAVLPCGGDEGAQLVRLLAAEGVDLVAVPIGGRTRSNITLAEPDGTVTKVNEPGPTLSAVEFDAVTGQALAAAGSAGWVVVCGSLPPGVTTEAFGRLCRRIVAAGVKLAVDTSGPALRAAAEAGAHLVKPNREELSDVVGGDLTSRADVVEAANRVRTWGAGAVLASLGADGAVLVTADTVVSGTAPVTHPRSSVGAGDALLAGFLAALTRPGLGRAAVRRPTGDRAAPTAALHDRTATPGADGPAPAPAGEAGPTATDGAARPTHEANAMAADRTGTPATTATNGEADPTVITERTGRSATTATNAEADPTAITERTGTSATIATNGDAGTTATTERTGTSATTATSGEADATATDGAARPTPEANAIAADRTGTPATTATNGEADPTATKERTATTATTASNGEGGPSATYGAARPSGDADVAARGADGRSDSWRSQLVAALAEGLAWGAAAVSLPGSRMPGPSDLRRDAVVIHTESDSDLVRTLAQPG